MYSPSTKSGGATFSSTSTKIPNHAQYLLARLLAGEGKTSLSSAIPISRSTRGAAPISVTSSTSSATFPGAKIVKLEQNYRSTEHILRAANGLIEENESRYEKNLWSDLGEGGKSHPLFRKQRPR